MSIPMSEKISLTSRARARLEALLKGPRAEEAFDEVQRQTVTDRAARLMRLEALDRDAEAELAPLRKAKIAADEQFTAAESAYRATLNAKNRAAMALYGREQDFAQARGDILRALREEAPEVITDYWRQLQNLRLGVLPLAVNRWIDEAARRRGDPYVESNSADVAAAAAVLADAEKRAAALAERALSVSEIGAALASIAADIAPALARLNLNPPALSAEGDEAFAPLPWVGKSEWTVGEARLDEAKGLAKAQREDISARAKALDRREATKRDPNL